MARVMDLVPGDEITLALDSAVFVARTEHPLYVGLDLVVWRMADGSWSHDALNRHQDVGQVTPSDHVTRIGRLRSALHGGGA